MNPVTTLLSRLGRRSHGSGGPPSERGLFVIGAARSGTTVLQNALNHAPQVFLLGEPDLHLEVGAEDFSARYNAMHRGWGNQETKSSFLPPGLAQDGPWEAHMAWLARSYRWVGAKVVVNARRDPAWIERFFAFQCRRFYRSRYVFTFRDPLAVVGSTRDLQRLGGAEIDDARALLANYAEVVALYVRMLRNLPHVQAVFHDDMGAQVLGALGRWLEVSLEGAETYYDPTRVRRYAVDAVDAVDPPDRPALDLVSTLYADLKTAAPHGRGRPQLEQNDTNFAPGHYTALGSIDRRARVIAADLRR